ncbi:sugar phosphate isomerase/epimerase and 4-hydroxyphenylpyruvate domain-containing protein [Cryobacterium melibiosiphilum]|uniref:3-dehydroshikimate dehydratase n=1 Tax=Cryobacterium melibiosiphilum TaxID=995039 RepID=A0A3A5MC36_9MICO|nr:sugar phosphate isomerase/epimerase and 4-hydroxyphenylpyruvate domain-containing protein [Cryobacterium melibiosiphilum]RJT85134.1 sugar phosphate isomerase/epimerase and 4-hydroxyphenylpyruvate domain-containing protein [Cryobacterium melibiosiphilum]
MRSSIATVCISGSLGDKLTAIADAGFDGYELFELDLVTSRLSPEEVVSRSADLGLSIDLYQPFRDFEGVTSDTLALNLRRAEHKFALMNRLGIDTMLLCSNVGTATLPGDAVAIDQLGALAALAETNGVRIAYEALAWGKFVSTYDHAWDLVKQVDHPALGVCLDSFHILSRGSDLETIATIPGEKIFFCQLADAPLMNLDVLSWSRHYRLFPGEGSWDLADFVARIVHAGYQGPLSLEVFNDVFRQGDPWVTARDARRSLVVLEDAARAARLPAPAVVVSGAAPAPALLTGLPAVDASRGFSFIELQPGAGTAVDVALTQLGFTPRGRHQRKNAELWSQNEVHVIVNHDLAGVQPRVAALGFEVTDVQRASARAVALRSHLLPRDRATDEDVLDGILAPDGTEVYFSERDGEAPSWLGEFGPADPAEAPASAALPPTGITHVDHVALVQPWQRADEAVLFYQSILGLVVSDGLDLAGEAGLVRSRSLVTADRGIRLALNVTPLQPGATDVYPNHVALHTDDLVATVTALRARGARLLPIPQNYYDDLDARLDLGSEVITTLRAHEILFDRDERGDFLHVYTMPVGQFFCEIVQRTGDYDGYGAANAPVRLAAQRAEERQHHTD